MLVKTQKNIIYQSLVMRNNDFDAFQEKSYFLRENGLAATIARKGLGPQGPSKKLAHWVDLNPHTF